MRKIKNSKSKNKSLAYVVQKLQKEDDASGKRCHYDDTESEDEDTDIEIYKHEDDEI